MCGTHLTLTPLVAYLSRFTPLLLGHRLVFCGPGENRTHHTLLARENRLALEHASPNKEINFAYVGGLYANSSTRFYVSRRIFISLLSLLDSNQHALSQSQVNCHYSKGQFIWLREWESNPPSPSL